MENKLEQLSQNLEGKDRDMETMKDKMIRIWEKVEKWHMIERELQQRPNGIETRIKDRIPELKTDLHTYKERAHWIFRKQEGKEANTQTHHHKAYEIPGWGKLHTVKINKKKLARWSWSNVYMSLGGKKSVTQEFYT